MLFSFAGELVFGDLSYAMDEELRQRNWRFLIEALDGIREADLVFKKGRIYIRKTDIGYLVILMALFAPIAMLRLNCDILLPSLKQAKPSKKLGRFFRK